MQNSTILTRDPAELNDTELFNLCKLYGANSLQWRRQFIGLLPEANRRRLYAKNGFHSIYEFAKKLAGLSEDLVDRAIGLESKLANLPELKKLFYSGEVSMHKLRRVVAIATPETDATLAIRVKQMSQPAIECYTRDFKIEQLESTKNVKTCDTLFNAGHTTRDADPTATRIAGPYADLTNYEIIAKSGRSPADMAAVSQKHDEIQGRHFFINCHIMRNMLALIFCGNLPGFTGFPEQEQGQGQGAGIPTEALPVGKDYAVAIKKRLLKLSLNSESIGKLEDLKMKGFDINKVLLELLTKREQEIHEEKARIKIELEEKQGVSRHIPNKVRQILQREYGDRCGVNGCVRRAANFHHKIRFSDSKNHSPYNLLPVCKGHHILAHYLDDDVQMFRARDKGT